MNIFFGPFFGVMTVAVLAGVVFVFASIIRVARAAPDADKNRNVMPTSTTFCLQDDVLPHQRAAFYPVLQEAVDQDTIVLMGVNLGDLVSAVGGTSRDRKIAWQRVAHKQVDFVLCSAHTLQPRAAILLFDPASPEPDWHRAQSMIALVLAQAGLMLLTFDAEDVEAEAIREALADLEEVPEAGPARLGVEQPTQILRQPVEVRPSAATAPLDTAPAKSQDQPKTSGTPLCPRCGAAMVLRADYDNAGTAHHYWRCQRYPRCRGVREVESHSA